MENRHVVYLYLNFKKKQIDYYHSKYYFHTKCNTKYIYT